MAPVNKLISSWNFEKVSGSDGFGSFIVEDVSNSFSGTAINFIEEDFIKKEYFLSNKKNNIDTLESSDSINILNTDDSSADLLHNSYSTNFILEKSMYQIISEDMLNMFSDINQYASLFGLPSNKYKDVYQDLETEKKQYFSKVLSKPDLERFLNFYRWLDSSLGYMLEQLLPENSNVVQSLKNTIESHVLEKNKFQHKIPLTISSNNVFKTSLPVIHKKSINGSVIQKKQKNGLIFVSDEIENIIEVNKIKSKYNHSIIQTSSKKINQRKNKLLNKSVFKNIFSSVDRRSYTAKDESGEYSIYNSLLNKSRDLINDLQKELSTPTANTQGDYNSTFLDNGFISRNIPYKEENYLIKKSNNTYSFPSKEILFRKRNNILIDESSDKYETSYEVLEPAVEFNIPVLHTLKTSENSAKMDVLSSYDNAINSFSYRNLKKDDEKLEKIFLQSLIDPEDISNKTFYKKAEELSSNNNLIIDRVEKGSICFPRQDKIGLAESRIKPRYEESVGFIKQSFFVPANLYLNSITAGKTSPWTNNSYNNPTHTIRSFWRDDEDDRKRTTASDNFKTGYFNCYEYINYFEGTNNIEGQKFIYNSTPHGSVYCMESDTDIQYVNVGPTTIISCSYETYGDLAPYSNLYHAKILNNDLYSQPKPEFVHNLFVNKQAVSQNDIGFVLNKSYQAQAHCNIKPFYDSYEDYRQNLKTKSQSFSVLPEFICSNYKSLILNNNLKLFKTARINGKMFIRQDYLKINGFEKNNILREETFKLDFKKFTNKQSNKIKIKVKVILMMYF